MKAWLCVVVLVVVGCKKKEESYEAFRAKQKADLAQKLGPVTKHKDTLPKQLAAIRAAIADANKAPAVTAREPIADGVKLPSADIPGDANKLVHEPLPDAAKPILEVGASAATPNKPVDEQWGADDEKRLAKYVAGDVDVEMDTPMDFDRTDHEWTDLEGNKWLAVRRTHEYTAPTSDGTTFTGASAAGDVIVYSLPDGKRVGAFPWEYRQMTDEISAEDHDDVTKKAASDFESQLAGMLYWELLAYGGNKPGPASPGASDAAKIAQFQDRVKNAVNKWLLEHQAMNLAAGVQFDFSSDKPLVTLQFEDESDAKAHEPELEKLVTDTLAAPVTVRIVRVAK